MANVWADVGMGRISDAAHEENIHYGKGREAGRVSYGVGGQLRSLPPR